MRTTLLFLFCCFFLTVENAFGQGKSEIYRMDDLEVTLPKGYKGHSRIMEGILNTSIRKEGSSPASQLIVTMIDMNASELGRPLLDEELLAIKDIFFEQNEMPGFKFGTVSDYTFKNHRGFQAKGTGDLYGTKINIVFKCVIFSHYMVQFQEWYGEDYSSNYEAIENSLRTCTKQNLSGMQVISKGGYSFTYNADKLYASVDERNDQLSFYFSFKEASYGDTFLQIDFTLKKTENLYLEAKKHLDTMSDLYSTSYGTFDIKQMEKATFLGKPGYMRIGTGVVKTSSQKVKFIQKVCDYNGLFTIGTIQESLNKNGQIPKEVEELFNAIEASVTYTH